MRLTSKRSFAAHPHRFAVLAQAAERFPEARPLMDIRMLGLRDAPD
jgi:hypothetical protein